MSEADALLGFLPRLARRRVLDAEEVTPWAEQVDSVVLAADVSGFTSLALSLRDTPGGYDQLRAVLNSAFLRLIQAIEEAGGDVLGFGGDALVALWPADPEAAAAAGWAALEAQRRLASGEHRVSVRLGITVGPSSLWTVGGERDAWFLTVGGPAPAEAAALQERAPLGGVAVSAAYAAYAGPQVTTAPGHGNDGSDEGVLSLLAVPHPPAPTARTGPSLPDDPVLLQRLRRFTPASVVDRVLAGHDDYLSELRTISTVMLRTRQTTPSGLDDLQSVTRLVQAVAQRYEAHLEIGVDEKGITFMLAFGMLASTHEDDADRALSAALAVERELDRLSIGHALGVATGQAFCGTLGDDVRRAYGVLSDAPCVAARLAGAALQPDRPSLLVDASTVAAVRVGWTFEAPVSLRLKGRSELFTAHPGPRRTARVRAAHQAMVGRDAERDEICRRVTEPGQDSLVVVEGEAGMGKSQLLADVSEVLRARGVRVLVGYADSLERAAPLHAWTSVFRDLLGLDERRDDTASVLAARVGDRAPLLSSVLAEEVPDNPHTTSLTGERRLAATRALLAELLAEAADGSEPAVVLLEDAHWFDTASRQLVSDARRAGLPLVVTTRPPDGDEAVGLPDAARLRLPPLSDDEVARLAAARLWAHAVDPPARRLLVETCQGNPFFVVELVRTMLEDGLVRVTDGVATLTGAGTPAVPRSVQAALTSRIDRLPAGHELTLKVASVLGRSFPTSVLARVHPSAPDETDLAAQLAVLVERGLLHPVGQDDHEFDHALTREVAYGLLLGDQRRRLHRAVAEHYEAAAGEDSRRYHALAHHWRLAEVDERAVHYLVLAAGASIAHGMPTEAASLGIAAAEILGITLETDPERIRATLPAELAEIDRLMAGRRPHHLAQLPELVDEQMGAGIGLVLQTMPAAHQSLQPELFALMAIRNLNLTLRFGSGPLAPGVYSMYATVLRGLGADSALAGEFSELARATDAAGGGQLSALVDFLHVWFHHHWHQPLRSAVPIALAGAEAGLSGADLLYGSFNLAAATTTLAFAGAPLAQVVETGERHLERIGSHSATASFHNRLEAQVAKALMGGTAGLQSLTDPVADERELVDMAESENYNQAAFYHLAKLRLAYLADDIGVALDHAERAYRLLPSFAGQFGQVELTLLSGLAQLADLPRGGALRAAALDEVRMKLAELDAWTPGCPGNFAHKASLLRGELAAAEGDPAAAQRAYADAVTEADRSGFRQWAALACERAGRAALATGGSDAAAYLAAATTRYRDWGATVKVAQLEGLQGLPTV